MRPLGRWRGVVGIVAAGLLATACGATAVSPQASSAQTVNPASVRGDIPRSVSGQRGPDVAVLDRWYRRDQAAWEQVAAVVTADHPGIKVTLQGAAWPDYWSKIGSQLAQSQRRRASSACRACARRRMADALVPLEDLMAKYGVKARTSTESILDGLKHDGKQIALPYDSGPLILYYNRDLFRAAGVPEPKPGWTRRGLQDGRGQADHGWQVRVRHGLRRPELPGLGADLSGAEVLDADGNLALELARVRRGLQAVRRADAIGQIAPPLTVDSWTATHASSNSARQRRDDDRRTVVGDQREEPVPSSTVGVAPMPAGAAGSKTYTAGSGFGISKRARIPTKPSRPSSR